MKNKFFQQIFDKYANIKFHEDPFCGSLVVPFRRMDRQTDMMKLIVAFRNFVNAPKNRVAKPCAIETSLVLCCAVLMVHTYSPAGQVLLS
jgi:hypothetical protein